MQHGKTPIFLAAPYEKWSISLSSHGKWQEMTDILHLDLAAGRMILNEMDKAIQDTVQDWERLSRSIRNLSETSWQGPASRDFVDLFAEIYSREKQQILELERLKRALLREMDQWEEAGNTFEF